MKPWATPCRATKDGWVIVKSYDKTWSIGGGNGNSPQHSCHEKHVTLWKDKRYDTGDEPPPPATRSEGVQYATGSEQRPIINTNSSRKNETAGPKWKQCSVVDGSGGKGKVQCCKEQYCIGTWNLRSMNQGKLDAVRQEMVKLNPDSSGVSELKWKGMDKFTSDDHYSYNCRQEYLRRKGVALIVNKRV